ncbi:TPA: tail fiber protein [Escherichia coli]|nr:phage tail protein [Escherichia coli]HCI8479103.1 tail fiber protein [Escherichia coli]HCN4656053.1 tail fiber protein [Escherichia coli]HDP6685484.1 tail fiber protein [Escherichia coli]
MSTRKFRTLITDIGLAKLAATTAPGGKPVRLTHMAVGDGNGELRQPQKNQTSLYNEVWRQSVNRVFTDPENPNRLIAELVIPPETGGFWVREIGVFDDTGTMIAVGNTAESYKPTREEGSGRAQIFRAVITVTSDAVVELVMDTTTILPTTDYIDEKIAEHARSRNHPDATLTEKGFTQLSSATNSTSETLAATPKAVKAAYDLAAGKAPASHTHPWSQITGVPAASLTAKGTVQLSSATDSQSETEAATPKAVKIAYDLARGKYTAQDATTTRKGIVQLSSAINSTSETLAATPKAVKAAYDLAAGKAPASHTHPWSQITGVPAASLTAKGTVQLSSAINSTSEILAATPKAVKAAYDLANGKQPADATLTALAGLATAADRLPYFTGADRAALATLTAIGRAIIAKGSIKDVLNYLGLGEGSALPVGVPVPWPTATPPAGWLKCDGRAFTKEQYPVLARAYPTLRLPDLRGEFIRGWDDGRKVDTGRKLLSAQGATLLRTAMLDYYNQDTTGTSGIVGMGFNNEDSITDLREGSFKMPDGTTFSDPVVVMSDNGMQATILTSIRSGYAKGITVRPRSIALNYIVRAV